MRTPDREAPLQAELARSRRAVLLLAIPLLLGLLLEVRGTSATLFGLAGPACVVGQWCGPAGCPGCGLTRATALALQGEPGAAAALNAAGPVLVLICVAGLVLHLDLLLRPRRRTRLHDRLSTWGARGFAAALLLAWFVRSI